MTTTDDTDPLAGPLDDENPTSDANPTGGEPAEPGTTTGDDDGSEWVPKPVPTEGDGPLP